MHRSRDPVDQWHFFHHLQRAERQFDGEHPCSILVERKHQPIDPWPDESRHDQSIRPCSHLRGFHKSGM